jgi:hypothetical protein
MTDLIHRLHREAEKRGVATTVTAYGTQGQVFENLIKRHPLEIAHELLAKLKDADFINLDWSEGDDWVWWDVRVSYPGIREAIITHGTFIECVVALAEAEK